MKENITCHTIHDFAAILNNGILFVTLQQYWIMVGNTYMYNSQFQQPCKDYFKSLSITENVCYGSYTYIYMCVGYPIRIWALDLPHEHTGDWCMHGAIPENVFLHLKLKWVRTVLFKQQATHGDIINLFYSHIQNWCSFAFLLFFHNQIMEWFVY